MKNSALLIVLILFFSFFELNAQNCPSYASTSSSSGEACGNQDYSFSVDNTSCNGEVYFDVVGNYGSYGSEITWEVVSNTSGAIVASGGPGVSNGAINTTIGPLDPNVHGNVFDLKVYDSYGDGFSGGGFIQTQQGGIVLADINGDFGAESHIIFNANIVISSATITVTTPSGPVTAVANNCNDFIVQVPLSNANFCTPINVNLPWTITCDVSGTTISSGTHAVTVNPQVPTDVSDLVDITWNTTSCSWEVSPENDCDLLDIGNIFTISPDPAGLSTGACGNGNENFTVDYLGVSGAPNCCETAGPLVNETYDQSLTSSDAVVASSPFGGTNNSALITIPPNNSGGNATSLDLCVDVSGFCFDPPSTETDQSFYVIIFIDGNQVYMSPQLTGNSHNVCINLLDVPGGYTQSSTVEVYVLPNIFSVPGFWPWDPTIYTTFAPNKTCSNLADGEWTADFTTTIDVVFDQMVGSPVACSFSLNAPYTCCDPTPPTASNPAAINIDCNNNIPAPDPSVVTGATSVCGTPPTITFVSDVSDGNVCQGEQITRTYRVEDDCGGHVNVTQLINVDATNPTFTLTANDPTICGGTDGEIIIDGLDPNTTFNLTYIQNGTVMGPTSITTNVSGQYTIAGLPEGSYTDFLISLSTCSSCVGSDVAGISLNSGAAATIDAGSDQTVCVGSTVVLTAFNPDGATISWNNGVTDGVAFTPPTGTTTYTVTADLSGCTSTDVVVVTVNPLPSPTINPIADQCENETTVTLSGNPSGGTFSGTAVSGTNFDPSLAGIGNHTLTYDYTDANGCSNSVTTIVNVVAGPSFTLTSNDPTSCLTTDGSITIEGLQASTTYEVSYQDASGNVIGPVNLTSDATGNVIISNLGHGDYLNFEVVLDGCSTTDNTTITLDVLGVPNIDAGPDVEVCEGETVILVADNPDGATISWDNAITDGVAFTPVVGTTEYTVTGDLLGCVATDVVRVTVVSNPIVDAGVDIDVCEGQQVTLSASGADTYTWNNGVVDGQPFSPSLGTTTYEVVGVTSEGCEGTDQVDVNVATGPDVSFISDVDKGCAPLTVNLTNTSTTNGDCVYTFSDGTVINGCNPVHVFENAGCMDVTLTITDNQGCEGSFTAIDFICVDEIPKASFIANPMVIGGLTNEVDFLNNSTGGDTYQWIFGDSTISTDVNPSHEYDVEEEFYEVTLIAESSAGCMDTTFLIIEVEEELIYYIPNTFTPDGNNVNQVFKPIFTSGFDPMDYHFTVFNRWGEIVFESYNVDFGWDGTYGYDGHGVVKDGTYIYKIDFKRSNNDKRQEISGHVNVIK
ncbi:PKD domain-containing protein [Brumimicrobium salinarum]|nr:PKD domain-containing protein [Brumimicrobium salinarum]